MENIGLTSIDAIEPCLAYFRATLAEGGALSAAMASHLEMFRAFYTLLPNQPPSTEFWRGGFKKPLRRITGPNSIMEQVATDDEALAEVIAHLARGQDGIVLFEKLGARRTDPFLRRLKSAVRFVGDEVLITASRDRLTSGHELLACIREASSLPTLGLLAIPGSEEVVAIEASTSVQLTTLSRVAVRCNRNLCKRIRW